jgi:branched-chain amino acid transport system permease protein
MNPRWKRLLLRWDVLTLAVLLLYPVVCTLVGRAFPDDLGPKFGYWLGDKVSTILIFGILALALNVAVGYAGLLQLGIAAFFAIGANITGVLTTSSYPFQTGFTVALVLATLGAGLLGLVLGAPSLRLRGDYLAIVTLGFGEIMRSLLTNLEQITAGVRGLTNMAPPHVPQWTLGVLGQTKQPGWTLDYAWFYYFALFFLAAIVVVLRNLETSRLGRAWIALREDELAAACMGINTTRVKLSAFAVSAALAGLAGCLFATKLQKTSDPVNYGFNLSITMLCCVILGGLGSIRGTLLGVFALVGLDIIASPVIDGWLQNWIPDGGRLLSFSNWRLMIFGLALILMMRFRPEGLLPTVRMKHELHNQ